MVAAVVQNMYDPGLVAAMDGRMAHLLHRNCVPGALKSALYHLCIGHQAVSRDHHVTCPGCTAQPRLRLRLFWTSTPGHEWKGPSQGKVDGAWGPNCVNAIYALAPDSHTLFFALLPLGRVLDHPFQCDLGASDDPSHEMRNRTKGYGEM